MDGISNNAESVETPSQMLISIAISSLDFLVKSALSGLLGFMIGIIGAPILLAAGIVIARVYVELIMLAFKMLETLKKIEAKQK